MRSRRRSKVTETIHGVFDSGAEARRYEELFLLAKAGQITDLFRQISFDLVVNGDLVGRYTPDFCYIVNGEPVAEEYKGRWTEASRLRVKLFRALYKDTYRYVVSGTQFDKRRKGNGGKKRKSKEA